jgi:hypothetical protein
MAQPAGYFEFEPVKRLRADWARLDGRARGSKSFICCYVNYRRTGALPIAWFS